MNRLGKPFEVQVLGPASCRDDVMSSLSGDDSFVTVTELVVKNRNANGTDVLLQLFSDSERIDRPDAIIVTCNSADVSSAHHVIDTMQCLPSSIPFCVCITQIEGESQEEFVQLMAEAEKMMEERTCAYGTVVTKVEDRTSWSGLIELLVTMLVTPPHILWDVQRSVIPHTGQRALLRAFWLLDKDGDGFLNESEVLAWQSTLPEEARESPEDIKEVLTNAAQNSKVSLLHEEKITKDGFVAFNHIALSEGKFQDVWAALFSTGIQSDGLPYSAFDLQCAHHDEKSTLHLSLVGEQFFSSLYKARNPSLMWSFTPPCPWADILTTPAPATKTLLLEDFLDGWRFTATKTPELLIKFARYWGFKGDPQALFSQQLLRQYRDGTTTARVAQVLLIGSQGSGKSSLILRMKDEDPAAEEWYRRDLACVMEAVDEHNNPRTVVLNEPSENTLGSMVTDRSWLSSIDLVLLVVDGTDSYSFSYAAAWHRRLRGESRLPFLFVLTKAEMPLAEPIFECSPETYCARNGLLWPPIVTSAVEDHIEGMKNDVDSLANMALQVVDSPELSQVEVITTARKIRRAFIVATAAAATILLIRKVFKKLRH